jgi:DNA processing protein
MDSLTLAVVSHSVLRTPGNIESVLRDGRQVLEQRVAAEPDVLAAEAGFVSELRDKGVEAVIRGDAEYPARLARLSNSPPILYTWGRRELLHLPSVGMCGARQASSAGIAAAGVCGEAAGRAGLTVVSGFARGVDRAAHKAALAAGGTTIVVLAEGIARSEPEVAAARLGADWHRVLVLSQFPPRQTWTPGGAMTRNGLIAGLGRALIVIEAGTTGGTLDAGNRGLAIGVPVYALAFEAEMPAGNLELIRRGALRLSRRGDLRQALAAAIAGMTPGQLGLPLEPVGS